LEAVESAVFILAKEAGIEGAFEALVHVALDFCVGLFGDGLPSGAIGRGSIGKLLVEVSPVAGGNGGVDFVPGIVPMRGEVFV